jgi:uncharacterized protein involved in propanediol utilization
MRPAVQPSIDERRTKMQTTARTFMDRVDLVHVAAPRHAGHGEAYAHHGEILQGVFYSTDGTLEQGLVTLPCPLFRTRASFRPLPSGPLRVEPCNRLRARTAARLTLDALGRTGWGGAVRIEGDVPLAWGCGSSTMDVLAVIRAVADAFGVTLEPEWLARLAVAAETASDSLMYAPERAVLFAQRRGSKLLDLGGPLPAARVLGFNTDREDGGVETLELPPCAYTWWELEAFGPLLGLLRRAVEHGDPELLGRVATVSTGINQRHRPKPLVPHLLRLAESAGAVGLQVAHSGTVAGLLFAPGGDAAGRIERARDGLRRLGVARSWEFSTDFTPRTERAS